MSQKIGIVWIVIPYQIKTSIWVYITLSWFVYVCSPGVRSQFTKMSTSTINSRGISYDYDSVMHYHSTAFGNGRITITRKDGSTRLGNNRGLSYKDIQQAKLMYCPGQPTRRPVTAKPRPPTGNQHASVSFFPGNFFSMKFFLILQCPVKSDTYRIRSGACVKITSLVFLASS